MDSALGRWRAHSAVAVAATDVAGWGSGAGRRGGAGRLVACGPERRPRRAGTAGGAAPAAQV